MSLGNGLGALVLPSGHNMLCIRSGGIQAA